MKEDDDGKEEGLQMEKMTNARALDLETPCPVSVKEKGRRGEDEPSRRAGRKDAQEMHIHINQDQRALAKSNHNQMKEAN